MSGMNDALRFLIETVFQLYLFILAARMLLAYAGANYFDPFTQFIVRCTDPVVKPVRKMLPNVRGIELSTLLIIFVLGTIKLMLMATLFSLPFSIVGLMLMALADTASLFISIMMYAIIIQALLSWMQPNSPVNFILYKITMPIMRPMQRICPMVGGIDISPIPALILLQLLIILIVNPLRMAGAGALLG